MSEFGRHSWRKFVEPGIVAYNMSFHRAISCAPSDLIGRKCEFSIDREYRIEAETNKEIFLRKAEETMEKYQKSYEKAAPNTAPILEIRDKVWYADPRKIKGKLSPTWQTKAVIAEKKFNSFKLMDEGRRFWIANERMVKKRF